MRENYGCFGAGAGYVHERVAAQSKLLEERAGPISNFKKDRDSWRQQATSLLTNQNLVTNSEAKRKKPVGGGIMTKFIGKKR